MNKLLFMTSKKILLLLSILFLWTCGGGGSSSPTEPVEPAPVSNFTATPTSGLQPLEVVFTSTATGTISSYAWNVDADTDIEGTAATFTHTYTDAGTYGVTLTVTGPGGSNPKTVADMITVTSAAPTPSTETSQTTQEEESITFALSATDPNSESVTFAIFSQPSYGQASINGSDLTYTPNENFYGIDTLEYTASNSNYTSNPAQINITVTGTDDGDPTSNNVTVSTNEDISVVIDLDATEIDGDSYSFSIISQPSNGSVSGLNGNQITYTPNENWYGTDQFTFEATDDKTSLRNVATATITVNPVNDAPYANDISAQLDENRNTPHTLNESNDFIDSRKNEINSNKVLKNSSIDIFNKNSLSKNTFQNNSFDSISNNQFDGSKENNLENSSLKPVVITLDATDVEGDALSYYLITNISNGTLEGVSSNSVRYTPNQDFNGTDTFTYGASDGNLDSNVATVTITINAINDAPETQNVSFTTDEDTPYTASYVSYVFDVDGDDLTVIGVTNPSNGTTSCDGIDCTYTPNQDFNGTDTFTYKVNDGELDSNISTVSVTINPINDAPVPEDLTVTAYKNAPVQFSLIANDVDGDEISWAFGNLPTNGTLEWVDENNGTLSFTPNQDFSGTDTFQYFAGDPLVWSDAALVTITVENFAQPPAFTNSDSYITVMGDHPREYINPGQFFNPDVMPYGTWRHAQSFNIFTTNPLKTYPNVNPNEFYKSIKVVPGPDGQNGTLTAFWNMEVRGQVSQTDETTNFILHPWTENNGIHLIENLEKEWYFYAKSCYEVYDQITYHELTCSEPQRFDVIFPYSFITSGEVENPWGASDSRYHLLTQDEGEDVTIRINNRAFTDPSQQVTVEIKELDKVNNSNIEFENPSGTKTIASATYFPTDEITDLTINFPYNDEDVKQSRAFILKFSYGGITDRDIWGQRFYMNSWRTANANVIIADSNQDQLWTLIDDFSINFDWDPGNAPYNSGPPNQLRMRIIEERNDGVAGSVVRYEETFPYASNVSFDPSSNIDLQNALHSRNCQGQIALYDQGDCWTTTMVFDSPDNDYRTFKTLPPDLDTSYMNVGVNATGNYFHENNGRLTFKKGMTGVRFEVSEGGIPSDASVVGRKFTFGQGTLLDTFSTINGVSRVALVNNDTNGYGLFIPSHLDVENKTNGGNTAFLPVNGNNGVNPGASKNFKEYNMSVSVSDPDGLFTGEHIDTRLSSTDIYVVDEYNDGNAPYASFCNLTSPGDTPFVEGQTYNICVKFTGDPFYRPLLRIVDTTNNDAVMWQKSYTYEDMVVGVVDGDPVHSSNIYQLYWTVPPGVFTYEQFHGKYRMELVDDYDSDTSLWGYGPKNDGTPHTTGVTSSTTDFVIRQN